MKLRTIFLVTVLAIVALIAGVAYLWHVQNSGIMIQPVFVSPLGGAWRAAPPIPLPILVWASLGTGTVMGVCGLAGPAWWRVMVLRRQLRQLERAARLAAASRAVPSPVISRPSAATPPSGQGDQAGDAAPPAPDAHEGGSL